MPTVWFLRGGFAYGLLKTNLYVNNYDALCGCGQVAAPGAQCDVKETW